MLPFLKKYKKTILLLLLLIVLLVSGFIVVTIVVALLIYYLLWREKQPGEEIPVVDDPPREESSGVVKKTVYQSGIIPFPIGETGYSLVKLMEDYITEDHVAIANDTKDLSGFDDRDYDKVYWIYHDETETPVGYISITTHEGKPYLEMLGFGKGSQSQGLGKKLVKPALKSLFGFQNGKFYLRVLKENKSAISFYKKYLGCTEFKDMGDRYEFECRVGN